MTKILLCLLVMPFRLLAGGSQFYELDALEIESTRKTPRSYTINTVPGFKCDAFKDDPLSWSICLGAKKEEAEQLHLAVLFKLNFIPYQNIAHFDRYQKENLNLNFLFDLNDKSRKSDLPFYSHNVYYWFMKSDIYSESDQFPTSFRTTSISFDLSNSKRRRLCSTFCYTATVKINYINRKNQKCSRKNLVRYQGPKSFKKTLSTRGKTALVIKPKLSSLKELKLYSFRFKQQEKGLTHSCTSHFKGKKENLSGKQLNSLESARSIRRTILSKRPIPLKTDDHDLLEVKILFQKIQE